MVFTGMQATLKDFQATMKAAKAKEASSLPRRPEPARAAAQAQDIESQQAGPAAGERAALLQVSPAALLCALQAGHAPHVSRTWPPRLILF
jgi:hypothetical protein